jgi:nitroimidazol reductase NimA-like FMN-containing flavoprotein (pyridoxamine 5'-phosphate oxidase superfamily)
VAVALVVMTCRGSGQSMYIHSSSSGAKLRNFEKGTSFVVKPRPLIYTLVVPVN